MINKAEFLIWVILPNHKRLTNYVSGMIKITKNVDNNEITSCTFSKSMTSEFKSIEEAHMDLKIHIKQRNKGKGVLNSIISYVEDTQAPCPVLQRDIYAIENQEKLIRQYLRYQGTISKGKSAVNVQILDLGNGIDMSETAGKNTLSLELGAINIHTLSMMYAIDVAIKNQFHSMMNYYQN